MARRRELYGIARGLLDSFNSRNNDVGGYWGIGVLNLIAQRSNLESMILDLLAEKVMLDSVQTTIVQKYKQMFLSRLQSRGIPSTWVQSALISISFNQPYSNPYQFMQSGLGGAPYLCTFEIKDELGVKRTAIFGGYCWPHNPRKESKSCREN